MPSEDLILHVHLQIPERAGSAQRTSGCCTSEHSTSSCPNSWQNTQCLNQLMCFCASDNTSAVTRELCRAHIKYWLCWKSQLPSASSLPFLSCWEASPLLYKSNSCGPRFFCTVLKKYFKLRTEHGKLSCCFSQLLHDSLVGKQGACSSTATSCGFVLM